MAGALTANRVRELLDYDAATGQFTWLVTASRVATAGSRAGSMDRNGYIRISLDGRRYLAHRLAWLMTHGEWPRGQIDHINGVRNDNRIANLRDVSACENQQNRHRAQGGNRFPWVCWKRSENRWRGCFRVNGRDVTVGHFRDPETAYAAVLEKRRQMGIGADGAPAVPAPEPAKAAA